MTEFEMTGRVGRDLRPDDVRIVAAREMNLRGNAIINVIDPTKSYQPTVPNADATCVIARRSIDARNDVVYRYRIEGYNHRFESYVPYEIPEYKDVTGSEPVVIVGAGPAGMFAALKLLTLGFKPVILERGKNVRDRKYDIAGLSREGVLNPESNYCYGEGGAGTFSDGKLFTRTSARCCTSSSTSEPALRFGWTLIRTLARIVFRRLSRTSASASCQGAGSIISAPRSPTWSAGATAP